MNLAMNRLHQTLNSLHRINSDAILEQLRMDVAASIKELPAPLTIEKSTDFRKTEQIDEVLYGKIVEKIIELFDENFPMINCKLDSVIEEFIVAEGSSFLMFHDTLVTLTGALKRSKGKVTNSLVIILERLVQGNSLFSAMTELCISEGNTAIEREERDSKWRSTIQLIVSLPNRVANELCGKTSDAFLPGNYARILSFHMAQSILFLNRNFRDVGSEIRVEPISALLSKVLVTLGSHKFELLVNVMSKWCIKNVENMSNYLQEIIKKVDRCAMEAIAILFLKCNESTSVVENVFRNSLSNPAWKHVFTVKIPLMSYHENEQLAKNLIAYLANSSNSKETLIELLLKLLDIWGDRSALNHTSLEQHFYITRLIIMSVKKVKVALTAEEKMETKRLLFSGTSIHLESTQDELRAIGMATGEILIELLNDSDDEPKLKYEYEGMSDRARELVKKLRNINNYKESKASEEKDACIGEMYENLEKDIYELRTESGILTKVPPNDLANAETNQLKYEEKIDDPCKMNKNLRQDSDDDLDSDDELAPYDMSNDIPATKKCCPMYLRDLRDNFQNAQSNADPNIFAESMRVSADLISSQLSKDDSSFAIELLQMFLTLVEESYVENFQVLKFNACVSIVLAFPKECAKYLCNEFHTKIGEYSIKDRVFMLNVLSESARRLSKIKINSDDRSNEIESKEVGVEKKMQRKRISLAIDTSSSKKYETLYDDDFEVMQDRNEPAVDWQEIVFMRIKSNTRRFAHSTILPPTTINKFNDVATSFFYPLLYGFRRDGTCMNKTQSAFEDQENIILVNYLKALATIIMAAENCVAAPKMGKEVLELTWSLRYHTQAKVRLCVIQNVASVILTLPKQGLTGEIMDLIFEFRSWLSDVSDDGTRGDPDSDCRNLGKNVVALIDSLFRSTLPQISS